MRAMCSWAWRIAFPTISPAGIEDVGNAYYDTLWGAGGLCQRSPLHYPKPAYVALATLTKVLDSAKLVRQMDTGSSSAMSWNLRAAASTSMRRGRIAASASCRSNCLQTTHLR